MAGRKRASTWSCCGWGKDPATQTGRTTCHRVVNFTVDGHIPTLGTLAPVHVEKAHPHSLSGRLSAADARLDGNRP